MILTIDRHYSGASLTSVLCQSTVEEVEHIELQDVINMLNQQ